MGHSMNRRDQELLDKQFRWLRPSPRNNGVMVLVVVGVFFSGIALGGSVFARESDAPQIVSNDATAAFFLPSGSHHERSDLDTPSQVVLRRVAQ